MSELFPGFGRVEPLMRAALAHRPRGLFTDIDGTISSIAPTPEAATLLPGIAEVLDQAVTTFDLVVAVSGRSAQDAARMVGNAHLLYIGNHGLETYEPASGADTIYPEALPFIAPLQHALERVGAELQPHWPGLRLEPKGATASIHVRNTSDPAAAEEEVYRVTQDIAAPLGLRVTRGRMVVELRPPVEVDKGVAVAAVIRERGLRSAFYLGDDRTDLDAFRALRHLTAEGACQGVAVAVAHDEAPAELTTEADVVLPNIAQVPGFLRWFVAQSMP